MGNKGLYVPMMWMWVQRRLYFAFCQGVWRRPLWRLELLAVLWAGWTPGRRRCWLWARPGARLARGGVHGAGWSGSIPGVKCRFKLPQWEM